MTCAETIKSELEAYNWAGSVYGITPSIAIIGIDELDKVPVDKGFIMLADDGEDARFACNGVRLPSLQYCELLFSETTTVLRDNLYSSIEDCFQNSSFSITFTNIKHDDVLMPYKTTIRVRLLN